MSKNNSEPEKSEYDLDKEITDLIVLNYIREKSSSSSQQHTYSGPDDSNALLTLSDRRSLRSLVLVIIIIVTLVLGVIVLCIQEIQDEIEEYNTEKAYKSAIELMMNDEYDEAYDLLFPYLFNDEYLESHNLSWLCEGMHYYEKGLYKSAYSYVKLIDNFDNLGDENQIAHMEAAMNTIEEAYEEYKEQEAAAKASKEAAEEAARAISDPYGAYNYSDPYEFYYDHVDDFEEYTDAVEYWNKHHGTSTSSSKSSSSGSTSSSSSSGKSSNSSSSSSSSSTKKDPYNASDYPDAEEFYYYHTDDFIDYEEAEDYWNKYH